MNEYTVGIDIGSSKICAAAGKIDKNGELQIIGITSVSCKGLKKGVVVDIDNTAESIKTCVEQLERMVDIDIKEAYISLPGGMTELIRNKGVIVISSEDREIRRNDVDRVLDAAKLINVSSDKEIVGIEPEQYIVDGYENIKEPIGMSGLRLEVDAQVIVAQTTVVSNLWKSVSKTGIEVKGIELQPKAASSIVLRQEEKEIGCVLLDIGSETIDLSVFKDNKICFTSMIPYGGSSITNDIALGLKIPFSEAEKLKLKFANLKNDELEIKEKITMRSAYDEIIEADYKFLNEIIEARVEELLKLIGEKIYKSGYFKEINNIVLVGGGFSLIKGIVEFSRKTLGRPVRIGSPNYVGASSPIYVSAVGIVKEITNNFKTSDMFSKHDEDYVKEKLRGKNKKEEYEEQNSLLSKVKEFFADFF